MKEPTVATRDDGNAASRALTRWTPFTVWPSMARDAG